MKVHVSTKFIAADAVAVFIPEKPFSPVLKKSFGTLLSPEIAAEVAVRMKNGDFVGKKNEILQIFPTTKGFSKCILVGTGDIKNTDETRRASALAVRALKKMKAKKITFIFPEGMSWQSLVSGAIAGGYEFKLGDTKERISVDLITLCSTQKISSAMLSEEVARAQAVNFTRDLVNLPAGHMSPDDLEQSARTLAKAKNISIKVLDAKQLLKLKMGGIMGVGKGSAIPPRMIILEYKGSKDAPIALVGKGVCFDSGGYNLKPTKHIEAMHSDMAGGGGGGGGFFFVKAKQTTHPTNLG